MQINLTTTNNYQKNTQKLGVNPSFKSIIPTEVKANGLIVTDRKLKSAIFAQLNRILFTPAGDNKLAKTIKALFQINDKSFVITHDSNLRGASLRHECVGWTDYVFTGAHAKELDELAKDIGRSQRGLKKKAEKQVARMKSSVPYYRKVETFVKNRIQHPRLHNRQGNELSLVIHTSVESGEVKIDRIEFKPLYSNRGSIVSTTPPSTQKPEPKTFQELIESITNSSAAQNTTSQETSQQMELFG